jgi:HK97 family phage portal protein
MSFRTNLRDFFNGFFDGSPNFANGFISSGGASQSGVEVNETTAMTVGAVAACQRIISSAIASLGCYVYEDLGDGGHRLAPEHPYFTMVSLTPSPEYPAVDFYATGTVNALQSGNTYAQIIRNNAGQPVELLIRSPFRTYPQRRGGSGVIEYVSMDTPTGVQLIVPAEDMIHVKNMGVNPYIGLSPIRMYMREVLGVALAAQAYGAKLFKNDARPGGYLYSTATVKPEDKLRQVQSWVAGHTGANQHMPAMLDGGVEWKNVGINPDEAQFLQTRQFQRSEIASIYGVPAHMLGDPTESKATIEQKALEFLIWTVKPWLRRWEQAMNVKLFPTSKDRKPGPKSARYFIKFDTSEYERSDFATTLKGIQTGRYAGLYTMDEGRKLLGLNPVTGDNFDETKPGKSLWRPVNMAIAGDDPAIYSSSGASNDSPDAPTEDQPAPADDGGDNSRTIKLYCDWFKDGLRVLSGFNHPSASAWVKVLGPSLKSLALSLASPDALNAVDGFVTVLHARGLDSVRANAELVVTEFQTIALASRPRTEETCE